MKLEVEILESRAAPCSMTGAGTALDPMKIPPPPVPVLPAGVIAWQHTAVDQSQLISVSQVGRLQADYLHVAQVQVQPGLDHAFESTLAHVSWTSPTASFETTDYHSVDDTFVLAAPAPTA